MMTIAYINAQIDYHNKQIKERAKRPPLDLMNPTFADLDHEAGTQAIRQQLAFYYGLKTIYSQKGYNEIKITSANRPYSRPYVEGHCA
jgi:hypothetical protein